ncbi:MAG: diadenylate cyclase CdaA [Planctomycetota bacterium]
MSIKEILTIAVQVGLLFAFFYFLLKNLQGTGGVGIFRGVIIGFVVVFILVKTVAKQFDLDTISWILNDWFLVFLIVSLVIIFQPELRRILLRLGQNPFFKPFLKTKSSIVDEVVEAIFELSGSKYGALVAIEREIGLKPYIEGGTYIDADVSNELIQTIFYPGSALHDGGVVIKDERVIAAGCLFPLTENKNIPKTIGTRHRAAIGLTEESDAIVLVASEETGQVSLCVNGQLKSGMDKEAIKKTIHDLYHK